MRHVPVLKEEVLSFIPSGAHHIVDCTVGDGGHSQAILEHVPTARILGLDADSAALKSAGDYLHAFSTRVRLVSAPFSTVLNVAQHEHVLPVDVVLADLGWSTPQFLTRGRGFSFDAPEEPLDMRFDTSHGETAAEILNTATEQEIGDILRKYGEEKSWRSLAHALVTTRKEKPFSKVGDLLDAVTSVKKRTGRLHPATLTFQALRIAVNHEFEELDALLNSLHKVLKKGGHALVITFHSLEDKKVKQFFETNRELFQPLTKRPLAASREEIVKNPPSRSAKLRAYVAI